MSQQGKKSLVADTQTRGDWDGTLSDSSKAQEANLSIKSSTTVFKAPIRSSLSVSQAATLSYFDIQSMKSRKVPHTQSVPGIRVTLPSPSQPLRQDIITPSVDNLMLQEQMLANKLTRTMSNRANSSHPIESKSLSMPYQSASLQNASEISDESDDNEGTTSSPGADVSGNCTSSWNVGIAEKKLPCCEFKSTEEHASLSQPPEANMTIAEKKKASGQLPSLKGHTLLSHPPKEQLDDLKTVPPLTETMNRNEVSIVPSQHLVQLQTTTSEPREMARRSFTLDKLHTVASASAAGLPIIGSDSKAHDHRGIESAAVLSSDIGTPTLLRKEARLNDQSSHHPHTQEKSRSPSLASSSPTIICLVVYPDAQISEEKALEGSVPVSLQEHLQKALNACKNSHAMQERNAMIKQQVKREVYLSYVQRVKEGEIHQLNHDNAPVGPNYGQEAEQNDSDKTTPPPTASHAVIPHSITRVISQPDSRHDTKTAGGNNDELLPQSSTAKKQPQPLRDFSLSPIRVAHTDVLGDESEGHKASRKADVTPVKSQKNPWIELANDKGQKSDMVS